MMGLTKKRREIGSQGVDEFLPFNLVSALKQIKVLSKRLHPRFPKTSRKPAIHHILLGWRKRNSGMLID